MDLKVCFTCLLFIVTSQALTEIEKNSLINIAQETGFQRFNIGNVGSSRLRIIIIGEPPHQTETCSNTSLGCCLPIMPGRRSPQRQFDFPQQPVVQPNNYCTPQGVVGFSILGVAFHSKLGRNCMDFNLMEGQLDQCGGRRSINGEYHYYVAPRHQNCTGKLPTNTPNIIGVALDGFPIYDSSFYLGFPHQLDECGGFMPDNDPLKYRYVATPSGPVISCFKGIPLNPSCCRCVECNTVQLPQCTRPSSNQRPQRGFGRRPQTNGFGRQRPNGQSRPDGVCTREQIRMLMGGRRPNRGEALDCSGCGQCVPVGGYSDQQTANRCLRCAASMNRQGNNGQGTRPSRGFFFNSVLNG